jgi:hypothetical protein
MTVWQEFLVFLGRNHFAAVTILGAGVGILLSLLLGGKLKSVGLYAALSLAFICGQVLVFLLCKWDSAPLYFSLAAEGILVGLLYGVLFAYLTLKCKRAERKARREEEKRRLQFILPEKENAYLRDRLIRALKIAQEKEGKEFSTDQESIGVRLSYARNMVAKLKESSLSPIERLDVEEMARTIALMERKESWSSSEIKMINEIFACFLKLSAKHEVAV